MVFPAYFCALTGTVGLHLHNIIYTVLYIFYNFLVVLYQDNFADLYIFIDNNLLITQSYSCNRGAPVYNYGFLLFFTYLPKVKARLSVSYISFIESLDFAPFSNSFMN